MAAILGILASIGSLAGAGTAIGETVAHSGTPSIPAPASTATTPTVPTITPQQIQQAGQQATISGANTQANTGQGLSPSAQASLLDQLYGTPG